MSQKPAPKHPAAAAKIRRALRHLYRTRLAEWHNELLTEAEPDWALLLSLHLQMRELECLLEGLEELG